MVKILQVFSATHRGGAETMIMNILRHTDHNEYQYDFISHIQGESDYDREIIGYGGKVFRIQSLGTVGLVKYINNLRKIIKENGPYDVVHCHTNLQASVVLVAAKLAGVNMRIAHSHNTSWSDTKNLKNSLWTIFAKPVIQLFSTNYLACGRDAGIAMFGKGNVDKGKVKIIQNGIYADKFFEVANNNEIRKNKKEELGLKNDEFIIGHIGRYHNQKNHEFVISMAKELKQRKLNCKIILVGTGEKKSEINMMINELKVTDIIIELGVRSDIEELFSIFDLFILPSRYEGLPLVLIEAQATNTMCFVSNNITKEADMGLNLLKYLNINEGVGLWVDGIEDIITKKTKLPLPSNKKVLSTINQKGYNSLYNAKKINKLYTNGNI